MSLLKWSKHSGWLMGDVYDYREMSRYLTACHSDTQYLYNVCIHCGFLESLKIFSCFELGVSDNTFTDKKT